MGDATQDDLVNRLVGEAIALSQAVVASSEALDYLASEPAILASLLTSEAARLERLLAKDPEATRRLLGEGGVELQDMFAAKILPLADLVATNEQFAGIVRHATTDDPELTNLLAGPDKPQTGTE